jgi:uncharacterized protein
VYPFASLPENLALFCTTLRRDHGFSIGPAEIVDAARAIEVVGLGDVQVVRDALRPVLSGTAAEAAVFDAAFMQFFLPDPIGQPQDRLEPMLRPLEGGIDRGREDAPPAEVRRSPTADIEAGDDESTVRGSPESEGEDTGDEPAAMIRSSYSPLHLDSVEAPGEVDVDAEWLAAARRFVRSVQLGLSHRWIPAPRGRRFDTRRVMRASLQTGGEALAPRWRHRQRRTPRFVVLIDGSRSMSPYSPASLRFAAALVRASRRVEVFTFSTALRRATADLRGARAQRDSEPPQDWNPRSWGGGTSIGACLRAFVREFGDRRLDRSTIVIIESDGLDLGAPDTLHAAMQELHRRAAAIVWLNPLIDTPGYAPTAQGMSVARPYVATFTSVADAAALARLGHVVAV